VFNRFRAQRIEPPSTGRIDRLVRSAFHAFEERWCEAVLRRLEPAIRDGLDELLVTSGADGSQDAQATESRRSILNELKSDAGAISLDQPLQ
jgi:hypothetical protein